MSASQFTEIALSQDELAFVLTLYGLNQISGFTIPTDFDHRNASAAGNALLRRGLAIAEADGFNIHPQVGLLVTSGAYYTTALGFNIYRNGLPDRLWCYALPDYMVYHSRPKTDTEHFQLVPNVAALLSFLASRFDLNRPEKPAESAFSTSKALLARADTVRNSAGEMASQQVLVGQGLPVSFARHVLNEAQQVTMVNIRVLEGRETKTVRAETITTMIILAEAGYWLLQEDPTDPEHLIVTPVNSALLSERIAVMLSL
jgi:hypothetical protein